MWCPFCGSVHTSVTDSRIILDGAVVRRRRKCLKCGSRFSTHEKRELLKFSVRKKGGNAEPYISEKLETGIRKALEKRPVSEEKIKRLVIRVEEEIARAGKRVIPSAVIGKTVMNHLRALDDVAYIRFASVYQDFKSVKGFDKEIRKLTKR